MPREIPKAYEPQEIEERWAKAWFDEKLFRAENSGNGPSFRSPFRRPTSPARSTSATCSSTRRLTCSSAGIACRATARCGLPGMDHAGIATQFVVERQLAKEKIRARILAARNSSAASGSGKRKAAASIKEQMIRLGASCDWTRERFTLEPALYRAVLEAFLRLYREGLIYRGRYMVNWCPRCQTAISDLEVVHNERTGKSLASSVIRLCGSATNSRRRHHAPRNDARRYGALPSIPTTNAISISSARTSMLPLDESRNSRHRGLVRRPRIRHRRRENHARARSQRLRSRQAAQSARNRRDDERRRT